MGTIQDIIDSYSGPQCSPSGAGNTNLLPQASLPEMRGLLVVTLIVGFLGIAIFSCEKLLEGKRRGRFGINPSLMKHKRVNKIGVPAGPD